MTVISNQIYAGDGFTIDDVLIYANLCSNPDKQDDPIDRAVIHAFKESPAVAERAKEYTQTSIIGFNPTVKRVTEESFLPWPRVCQPRLSILKPVLRTITNVNGR